MSRWHEVAELVAGVAPTLGAALAGPGGAAAGRLLAAGLGVASTPDDVYAAVASDPQATLKLRQLEADLEKTLIGARGGAVTAEIQGESWLQRNWRPLLMLWFGVLMGGYWFGLTPDTLTESTIEALFAIVQVGLGGYVIGRSAEKITKTVSGAGLFDHLAGKVRK